MFPAKSKFLLWQNAAVYIGPGIDSKLHSHFAGQILLSPSDFFQYRESTEQTWKKARAFYVPPCTTQQVIAPGNNNALVMTVYLDVWCQEFNELHQFNNYHSKVILPLLLSRWLWQRLRETVEEATPELVRNTAKQVINQLSICRKNFQAPQSNKWQQPMQRRFLPVLEYIEYNIVGNLCVEHLARLAHLSPSRFSALFTEAIGVSVRKYIIWRRLRLACQRICLGTHRLTDIALDLGFTDQAHFSNCFSRFFGISPRSIFLGANSEIISMMADTPFSLTDDSNIGTFIDTQKTPVSSVPIH